jgi:2-hydroxy-3-oxopropionate reductase
MKLERVGFVGLGIMGKPMARNLLSVGYNLVVQTRSPKKAEEAR